mmetsp:Transcript_12571/g.36116  ORF Transcript_12571/g.36116 Transcript_12571/m.36116 type:complete len:214 (+) Transcript_12571:336-977(+)
MPQVHRLVPQADRRHRVPDEGPSVLARPPLRQHERRREAADGRGHEQQQHEQGEELDAPNVPLGEAHTPDRRHAPVVARTGTGDALHLHGLHRQPHSAGDVSPADLGREVCNEGAAQRHGKGQEQRDADQRYDDGRQLARLRLWGEVAIADGGDEHDGEVERRLEAPRVLVRHVGQAPVVAVVGDDLLDDIALLGVEVALLHQARELMRISRP